MVITLDSSAFLFFTFLRSWSEAGVKTELEDGANDKCKRDSENKVVIEIKMIVEKHSNGSWQ